MRLNTAFVFAAAVTAHVQAALRQYTLNITHGSVAPDGVSRRAWLVNGTAGLVGAESFADSHYTGATPGPTILADEGDQLSIKVTNNGDEPITIQSDGVPTITQYPIAVGHSFVYNWTATQMGYHWYHSHYQLQVDDGLRGDIYLRPKADRASPFSLISSDAADIAAMKAAEKNPNRLFIYDWKHKTSTDYMNEWKRTMVEPLCLDDILINGHGQMVCPIRAILDPVVNPVVGKATDKGPLPNTQNTTTELEVIKVNPAAKWAAFNCFLGLILHKQSTLLAFGIFEFIGVPIGERYQFFIKLDKPEKDYTIRVAAAVLPQKLSGFGVLQYDSSVPVPTKRGVPAIDGPTKVKRTVYTTPHPKNPFIDYGGNAIGSARELNPIDIKPYPANPPPKPAASQIVTVRLNAERTSELGWLLNNRSWVEAPDSTPPILFDLNQANSVDPALKFTTLDEQYVDVIMVITSGNPSKHPPHPIHKHGVKGWFLGWGSGGFPYNTVAEAAAAGLAGLNMVDPQYRDTFVTPPGLGGQNWIAFRFKSSDPGPTFIHCHIDPHLAVGMAIVMLEGIDKWPTVPSYYLSHP
ncbi:hypothetical protein FRC10_001540 [Ceratobasidium sp. 414]|nr:hypothetical protein FRC10_001540 [Ceratobasidium sp. 414]